VKKVWRLVAGTVAGVAAMAGVASPASAAHKDGKCDSGELCLFYSDGFGGAWIDYTFGDNDHRNDRFIGGAGRAGYNQPVNDAAQSAWNFDPDNWAVIATLLACEGSTQILEDNANVSRLDDGIWNQNWSNCWAG
jgi:Peptidase inhibitor family I36